MTLHQEHPGKRIRNVSLFCQTKTKRRQGKGSERLSLCERFEASQRILEAARAKNDERVVLELQSNPDCIVTDTLCQRSCYAKYTLCTTLAYRHAADKPSLPCMTRHSTLLLAPSRQRS